MIPKDIKSTNDACDPVVKAIRDFVKQCPYLPEFYKSLNVDYQGADVGCYMIESTPADPWVKKYTNGSGIKQFPFVFSSKEYHSASVQENINNSGFYEHFAEWLEECARNGVFPELEGNRKGMKIFASTSGYVYDTENGKAQYVIQCNFHYFQF